MLTVVFLAIVVGVVFFPGWERWGGKSDRAVAQAVAFGADSEALRGEVEKRMEASGEFRRNMQAWYLALVGEEDLEKRRLAWMWKGELWSDGELAQALEKRIGVAGDDGVRFRLLEFYLDGESADAGFLVGLLDDAVLSGEVAIWLIKKGAVPEGEEEGVARVLLLAGGAGVREAMKGFYEGGSLGREPYARWLERVIKEVEEGDGSCCPGGREERARVLGELEAELAEVTSGD